MLVLSRQRDETITLGGPGTVVLDLTQLEQAVMRKLFIATEHLVPGKVQLEHLQRFQAFVAELNLPEFEAVLSVIRNLWNYADYKGPIEISVVDIRGDKVRLGISAPRKLSVHRKEVYEAIQRENPDQLSLKAG